MNEENIDNLPDLEDRVRELRDKLRDSKKYKGQILSKPLFRGESNSNWNLETTLERYVEKTYSVSAYNRVLTRVAPATSSFTGKEWPLEQHVEIDPEKSSFYPPNYQFMTHTRHHGFPSPLLDWSRSLYVALFFAFQNNNESDSIAIYCYIETWGSCAKVTVEGSPIIWPLGPYLNTHKRHFAQQGQYTVAVQNKQKNWEYCSHQDALDSSKLDTHDFIVKFVMPGSIKTEVLSKLYEMNINAFTLLGGEDALMSTLAFGEITMD
ncbi:FRG domain-containing protein [Porticoccaceae bacterium]|nr:FRG domain-containing protein [Porticoccaceae bacterium]